MKSSSRLLPWGLLLTLMAHAELQAQPADEVQVQAGRLAQRQFDTAGSISVIDSRALQEAGPQVNLSEALANAPGVVALNRNNYAQDLQISIRGFGARAAFGLRGIRLITDGIPATIPDGQGQASTVSLTSAERIEVLTGPLAQLYGNSAGGVIQTFTRQAGAQPEALGQLTWGSSGLQRYDAQLSGRSGRVGMVADYSEFSTQGWREHSAARRKQFNSVITAELQEGTRLKLVASVFDMPEAQDPLGLTAAQLAANPRQAGNNALINNTRKSVDQRQIGAVLDHRLDADLQMQMRVYSGNRENLQYQAGSKAATPLVGSWVGLSREFSGLGLQLQGRQQPLSGGQLQWVVGLDADQSVEQRQGGDTLSGEKINGLTRNERNRASNQDAYAQANWHLDPAVAPLTLTTGLRHSAVTLSSRDDYLTDGVDGSGQVRYQANNPVLGATWHVADTLNVYAHWGKGFETPTLAEAAYSVVTSAGTPSVKGLFNPNLLASRSQHREAGLKWTPDPTQRLQAALFYITAQNELTAALSDAGKTAYINATSTRRQGAELSWQSQWTPHWRTLTSASWLQALYTDAFTSLSKSGLTTTSRTVAAGRHMPGIPAQQLFASLQWAESGFTAVQRRAPNGWSSSVDWVLRSEMWASDANDAASRAPGYGLLNLKVRHTTHWGRAQLEGWLGIDNLSNRTTVGSVIVNQSAQQYFESGLPRQWMAGLRLTAPL